MGGGAHVVTRGEGGRSEGLGDVPQSPELDLLIAGNAWAWGFTGEVPGDERVDNVLAEGAPLIENIVRDT